MGQWLTPDSYPDRTGIALFIPNSSEARQVLSGALLSLAESYNWEEFGEMTPAAAAAVWADVLIDFQAKRGRAMHVGDIFLAAYDAGDLYTLKANGASLLRSDYPLLFAAIGTTYGSADGDHFTLPDLRGRVPVGEGQGAGLTQRDRGDSGGEETHLLTTGEIPVHAHAIPSKATASAAWTGNMAAATGSAIADGTTRVAGSGGTHQNMQPWQCLSYFIVVN